MSDTMTREVLLALTPARYLANGFLQPDGTPRAELRTDWATAAATQLLAAEAAPQELAFTVEALRAVLPLHDEGPPDERATEAVDEALDVVAGLIRQDNNGGIVTWLRGCAAQVRQPDDLAALLLHVESVLKLYGLLASLSQPPSPES
jgi:hypothetical protein